MCSEIKDEGLLKLIQRQFLSGVPANKIDWHNIFDDFQLDDQKSLINSTVNLASVIKYPLKVSYQTAFLKSILKKLDEQESEIDDVVYSAFGRVVALGDFCDCFKHYLLENRKCITLKESSSFISKGTTGLCSWQAASALSEWCLVNRTLFEDKTVLELGSGVGLTGIAVAANCHPRKIYLTDCHSDVLQVLGDNVLLNDSLVERTVIRVLNLPWEKIDGDFCKETKVDLLLAADVVYDSSLFTPFLNAVLCFFQEGGVRELIIACTERNSVTLGDFLLLLEKTNLCYQELNAVEQKNFIWSTECPIRMFSVKNPIVNF